MVMSATTSVATLVASRRLAQAHGAMTTSLMRLSSGHRINRAADDASGLAISEGLRSQIRGMTQAVRNAQDGISVLQTAEGALNETSSVLLRMRELAVQSANDGALNSDARAVIQKEIAQLQRELDRIAGTSTWNGTKLLDGTYRGTFQVGADAGQTISVAIGRPGLDMSASGLGLSSIDVTSAGSGFPATVTPAVSDAEGTPSPGRLALAGDFGTVAAFSRLRGTVSYDGKTFDLGSVDYSGAVTVQDHIDALNAAARPVLGTAGWPFTSTSGALSFTGDTPGAGSTAADALALTPAYAASTDAGGAMTAIDKAVARVTAIRADLGAVQNRLEHTVDRLGISIVDTTASESRIRDTDMAAEMAEFTRNRVLTQAGTAMLAQAGGSAWGILRLLA